MPSEEQNCQALVTVTGDDVTNSVKVIPRLETLVSLSTVAMGDEICHTFVSTCYSTDSIASCLRERPNQGWQKPSFLEEVF